MIGFLSGHDPHHQAAVERVRASLAPGTRRLLCAVTVNYAEILIGPIRAGVQERVKTMLTQFGIETIQVDMALAEHAAAVRGRTNLKLPAAFALATVIHAEHRGAEDVQLASFDEKVIKARAALHPAG
jgi:predicted nucleic acid-binding protein